MVMVAEMCQKTNIYSLEWDIDEENVEWQHELPQCLYMHLHAPVRTGYCQRGLREFEMGTQKYIEAC